MTEMSGLFVDGAWRTAGRTADVVDKYRLEPVARVTLAEQADVAAAVEAAASAAHRTPLSPRERAAILRRAAEVLSGYASEVVETYVAETGFTVTDGRGELARTINTINLSADAALSLAGEEVPVAAAEGGEHRLAFTTRVPVGIVCAIAPFNAPLNTVAHKIAPGFAAGNGVVLKPATPTPLSSGWLCRAFDEAGLPPGYLNMVNGSGADVGEWLLADRRIRFFTFTGSTEVGLKVKQSSGIAKTHLELGSNSASIVCADADLAQVAALVARAGFRKAGQVCTSVQRLLVEESAARELIDQVAGRVQELSAGDPTLDDTDVGPMIAPREAERVAAWISESVEAGARLVTGGSREGPLVHPAVLTDTPSDSRLMCDEVFGPVVAISTWTEFGEAIETANSTPYGLQAGIFTRDIDRAFAAARRLEVGGVMINDTSSYHADLMPYGGVKDSGYGLEGPRYAVQDMTNPRIIVLNLSPADEVR